MVTKNIGMTYSGIGPDYRVLLRSARKLAQQYSLMYQEQIPTAQLVQRVANVMQEYTQQGGVRPFGVSLLLAGWDEDGGHPFLYQCDPSEAQDTYLLQKICLTKLPFIDRQSPRRINWCRFDAWKKYTI
ncbi:Proteasome subunit alpha type-2 [Lamellibrachia satsuma]|nr:Proteasome subunit alpha type-2 [Lamellibrachia satsuma]